MEDSWFAVVGLRAAVGLPRFQGAVGFAAVGLRAAIGLAAPLGLSVCRCRLAVVGHQAAVGLPQLVCRARFFSNSNLCNP